MDSSRFPFSIITAKTIRPLIFEDLRGCIDVVRDAYLAHAEDRSVNPQSVFLRFKDQANARIGALPAHLGSPWNVSGVKWVASYPDNVARGFPRASAVLILNNDEDGYPFACLEGSIISAARTAASAVLAATHLRKGKHRVPVLGIVGTGLIAEYVYRFLIGTEWEIETIHLYDIDRNRAEQFESKVCKAEHHAEVRIISELSCLLRSSDLVLFATTAARPQVDDVKLVEHRPVILHISLRDLTPTFLLNACNIVDDIDHVMQAETSVHLTEQLTGNRNFVTGTLTEVMTGRCIVDSSRPLIFSPFGLGVLDLALGKWLYDRAIARAEHRIIDGFFES